jgi:hypothetical protein
MEGIRHEAFLFLKDVNHGYFLEVKNLIRLEKFVRPVWIRTRFDLILLKSQTDSIQTRPTKIPR